MKEFRQEVLQNANTLPYITRIVGDKRWRDTGNNRFQQSPSCIDLPIKAMQVQDNSAESGCVRFIDRLIRLLTETKKRCKLIKFSWSDDQEKSPTIV